MKRSNIKVKVISIVLVVVTVFSTLTVSFSTASAAETKSSKKVSINTDATLTGLTTSVVGKAIDIATKSNPVASILGAGVSSVFGNLFSAIFSDPGPTTQDILDAVKELSDKVDADHAEEMKELSVIQKMVEQVQDTLDLQGFNSSYRTMNNLYTTVFDFIYYKLPDDAQEIGGENKIIDEETYDAYNEILTKVGFYTSPEIEVQFNDIYKYLSKSNDNTFNTIAEKYINATRKIGPMDFFEVGDLSQLKENLQQIQGDVVMYYTAYITLIQMDYQCKNYKKNAGKSDSEYSAYPTAAFEKQFEDLAAKLSKIDEAFNDVCDYIESHITAVVEMGMLPGLWRSTDVKYFAFTPLAWSVAATTAKNRAYEYSNIKFYLYEDWVAPSADVGLAIDKDYLNYDGFDKQYGTLTFTTDRGIWIDVSLDGGHIIDGTKMNSNVRRLLNVTLNKDMGALEFLKSERCFSTPSKQFAVGDGGWFSVNRELNWGVYENGLEEYFTFN